MRTQPNQDAHGTHDTQTLERKPDDRVRTTPDDSPPRHPEPREEGDDFSVLLHLGLV